jgi:multidrug efflux system membrane fusion protein
MARFIVPRGAIGECVMSWRRYAVIVASLLLAAGIGWRVIQPSQAEGTAQAAPPTAVPVTTAAASIQNVPVYLDGLGTVQAFNAVEMKAQVNGNLTALPVHEGQEVHIGQVVAEIDPTPYKAALDQAIAQRAEDLAQLQSAQLDLQRYESLARRSFAPVQQVDDQRATVNKYAAAVQLDTAAIEIAQFNLDNCVLRAPINGRVGLYQVDIGNLIEVASQTGIVSITQDKPIAVLFTLPESELQQVQAALQRGTVPVEATDSTDPNKVLATGKLETTENTINTATGTIALKAIFPNQDDKLWPGAFVNARVQVGTLQHAVTIPEVAVQHGPDGLFVFVVKPDQSVAQLGIKVGYQDGGRSVVTSGLNGSETVVLSGQSRLSPGTRVAATDQSKAPVASGDPENGSAGGDSG